MVTTRRLLSLTPEPWPTFRPDVAILLGRELPKLGIAVDLVAAKNPDVDWQPWSGGEAFLSGRQRGRYLKHIERLGHVMWALVSARADRYDAIQVRDMPVMAALALAVGKLRGIPVVYWMSYPISLGLIQLAAERRREGQRWRWIPTWLRGTVGQWLLQSLVLPRAHMVVVQSDHMRDVLVSQGVDAGRLVPVPMGVDLAAVRVLLQSPIEATYPGRRVVGYLGSLDRPRRIDLLLQMTALLRVKIPEVLLLLVGDTQDKAHRASLHRQIAALDLEKHVVITGWLPTAQAWQRLRCAEVALSPVPRGELLDVASPTKVPEYLALGIPVVCNDNPDQEGLINACGAGTSVPYTAANFEQAVLHWLTMVPEARMRRARVGTEYVQQQRDYPMLAQALARKYESRFLTQPRTNPDTR